jgi:hypothetical protein
MPRYKLRTLLILLAVGPPMLAGVWFAREKAVERYRQWEFDQLVELIRTTIRPSTGDLTDNTVADELPPSE